MKPEQPLQQHIELVNREDQHLLAVRRRLLDDDCYVDAQRVQTIIETDTGIDRLESFGAKFARMQDTVVDKLIPRFLIAAGEQPQTAMDNLSRMERLELIISADNWQTMRWLRNRLVPEYIDNPDILAPALEQAYRFTDTMHSNYGASKTYAADKLGIRHA